MKNASRLFLFALMLAFLASMTTSCVGGGGETKNESEVELGELDENALNDPLPGSDESLPGEARSGTGTGKAKGSLKERELRKIGEKFVEELLEGLNEDDYELFSENQIYELKSTITKDKFKIMVDRMRKDLGEYQSRQYLGFLKSGPFETLMWKAKYSKSPNDVLVSLSLGELDGAYKVFGFNFK